MCIIALEEVLFISDCIIIIRSLSCLNVCISAIKSVLQVYRPILRCLQIYKLTGPRWPVVVHEQSESIIQVLRHRCLESVKWTTGMVVWNKIFLHIPVIYSFIWIRLMGT